MNSQFLKRVLAVAVLMLTAISSVWPTANIIILAYAIICFTQEPTVWGGIELLLAAACVITYGTDLVINWLSYFAAICDVLWAFRR